MLPFGPALGGARMFTPSPPLRSPVAEPNVWVWSRKLVRMEPPTWWQLAPPCANSDGTSKKNDSNAERIIFPQEFAVEVFGTNRVQPFLLLPRERKKRWTPVLVPVLLRKR